MSLPSALSSLVMAPVASNMCVLYFNYGSLSICCDRSFIQIAILALVADISNITGRISGSGYELRNIDGIGYLEKKLPIRIF